MQRTAFQRFITKVGILALTGLSLPAFAEWELNMPVGVTDMSKDIYDLHMIIFLVCVVIGILVFGAMIYSIFRHRKSVNPEPATFSHSTTAEVAWTVVPIIILIVMAFPAAKVLVEMEDASGSDMSVKVTGYQWNWHYDYLDEGIAFYSKLDEASNIARQVNSGIDVTTVPHYLRNVDKPMVVPVGKKVRILLTANDVIHAWWVPELGGKKDAIPGFVNTMWFKANEVGTYRGQCAELCGRDHGFMPIVVEVVSESDYADWVAEQTAGTNAAALEQQPLSVSTAPAAAQVETVEAEAEAIGDTVEMAASGSTTSGSTAAASAAVDQATAAPAAAPAMDQAAMMKRGEEVYLQRCAACHQPDGAGMPPTFPALTGSAMVQGPAEAHIDNVLNGVAGTAMLGFGPQLSDEDIAAVVTYERNALGNSVGDAVTPEDVAALRSK